MNITIILKGFEIFETGKPINGRSMVGFVPCSMRIGEEVIESEWHECMNIISERFPGIEFTGSWNGRIFTMTPDPSRRFIIDPACPIFALEVK